MDQHFAFARTPVRGSGAERSCPQLLFGYFASDEFAWHGTPARPGAFVERIRDREFWRSNFYRGDRIMYSEAIEHFLQHRFHGTGVPRFELLMSMWAASFYETRLDATTASNLLVLFLRQNLDTLESLHVLERAENQHLAPNEIAIAACVKSAKLAGTIVIPAFSQWVLEDWLPFHLRYYHGRNRSFDEF